MRYQQHLWRKNKKKRGGERARRTARLKRAYQESAGRAASSSELAQDGRSRASGSGAMRHPAAHWLVVYAKGASGTAVAFAIGWEGWRLLTTVRHVAEHAVEEVVSEILVTQSRAQEALREVVDEGQAMLATLGRQVTALGIQLGQSAQDWMELLKPNPFVLPLVGVYVAVLVLEHVGRRALRQAWEARPWAEPSRWTRTPKQQLADSGRNPESNTNRTDDIALQHLEVRARAIAGPTEWRPHR